MIVQKSGQGNKWHIPGVGVVGKMNSAVRLCLWLALLVLGFSGGSVMAGGMPDDAADAPLGESEVARILASPEAAAAGEGLFNQVCVYCHGAKGIGGKARKMQCRTYDPNYLFNTIANGKKRGAFVMPSWKQSYDDKTMWELASYIMTLKDLEHCQ
ncbi:MAG: cytochrome c [Gammaproteobacteria bacterium]|nr:MAG: cytochrome c [Gammaproteobacteria bacterium]